MTATVLALRRRIEAEQVATMEKMTACLDMLIKHNVLLSARVNRLEAKVARLEKGAKP